MKEYIQNIINEIDLISEERKKVIQPLIEYIQTNSLDNKEVNLNFICTHNSRRSHISQIWAQKAADYYGIKNVYCFSGGTEATAFNPLAVKALQKAGFEINKNNDESNPVYFVQISENVGSLKCFSKVYNDDFNPQKNFAAIMTCSHADENCPTVFGADVRIPIRYNDPKEYDGTDLVEQKYDEKCREIATEMFYVFKEVAK